MSIYMAYKHIVPDFSFTEKDPSIHENLSIKLDKGGRTYNVNIDPDISDSSKKQHAPRIKVYLNDDEYGTYPISIADKCIKYDEGLLNYATTKTDNIAYAISAFMMDEIIDYASNGTTESYRNLKSKENAFKRLTYKERERLVDEGKRKAIIINKKRR